MSPRLLFGFCIALALCLLMLHYFVSSRSIIELVGSCVDKGCFDLQVGEKFQPVIQTFVDATRFEGKINTQSKPQLGYLNFYVASSKLPGRLSGIKCNCAYIGSDTIICDEAFLRSFSSSVNFTRDSIYGKDADKIWEDVRRTLSKVNDDTSTNLAAWIIGHEIGHAVLHETSSSLRRIAMTREMENAADSYYLDRALAAKDPKAADKVSWALNQFIFQAVSLTYANGKARIAASVDDVHDPWLLRAMALGQRIVDKSRNPADDFYKSLGQSISVEPTGSGVGSFCEFQNIREKAAKKQEQRLKEQPD